MSSYSMLDDENALNDINPYADPKRFTPGVRYNGGSYPDKLPYGKIPEEEKSQWEDKEESIGCQLTRSAGTGTASFCTPKTGECPIGRPSYPMRNIEQGRWSLPKMLEKVLPEEMVKKGIKCFPLLIILLIILFVVSSD